MDFAFSPADEKFRQEVRAFLQKEVTPQVVEEVGFALEPGPHTRMFLKKLGAKGWLAPAFPKEYGGLGTTRIQQFIITDELSYHRAQPLILVGVGIVGPTLLMYGSEEQKRKFLPRIASSDIVDFALGYTEPEAGSDLTGIQVRAIREGGHYKINGGKLFNTGCHYADYVWLAARTSTEGPKHRGISLFMVDMKTPGITVRPMYVMDGERTNEVFYDDVRVPLDALVGEENQGFKYMLTALAHERSFPVGGIRRAFEEFVALVREENLACDARARETIAQLATELQALYLLAYRVAWLGDQHRIPEWEAPMVKLTLTEFMKKFSSAAIDILGPRGLLRSGSKGALMQGTLEWMYRHAARRTISAGTSEIMRNTIAQRGLGMPR